MNTQWKRILAWSLYDFGNSAFATTVMAGFFPIFFKEYWSVGVDVTESTFKLGLANSIAGILVLLLAPALGAMADIGGARKRFLVAFTAMGCAMTIALFFVGQGNWVLAAAFFVAGTIGFAGGSAFYDSLIIDVTQEDKVDLVSALGYAFGYLGGGLLFSVNVVMVLKPGLFGLLDKAQAIRVSFLMVGLWWAVFTVPLLIYVKEARPERSGPWTGVVKEGFGQLAETFRQVRHLKVVSLFLLGYWLYIDGVYTIIRMAIDYGMSIGLDSNRLILALLVVQFVGFPAAIAFGKLGQRLGPRTGIYIAISVYILITVWAYFLDSEVEFFAMAAAIGLVQGGIQSLSRSFYVRIIPRQQSAEFFGFYNMVGKFAAVLGPFLVGWTALVTGDPRKGMFSITVLLLLGGILFFFVDEDKGREMVRIMENGE
ncbi:MFS transporter [bacterium]|nr:MFS transporter [bacterium]